MISIQELKSINLQSIEYQGYRIIEPLLTDKVIVNNILKSIMPLPDHIWEKLPQSVKKQVLSNV